MVSGIKTSMGAPVNTSRPSGKVAEVDKSARSLSRDSLKSKMTKAEEPQKPNKSEEQLKAFKSDFDSLRTLVTCKICDRLLYEPYIISCGHTYCYSCLCTWFVNNKARKTCPDCRAVVTQAPAPAYVIRDMTLIFINRAELLPLGETIEQHTKWQKEEAEIVQQDKNNTDTRTGGLFKGCFRSSTKGTLRPIRDEEDGVDRCPMCSWELEDGECAQCGLMFDDNGTLTWGDSFGGFSDMDETSEHDLSGEDVDGEIDMEDAELGYGDYGDAGMDGWGDYLDDDHSFVMRRFLTHGIPPPQQLDGRRRRMMTHSEAGSRRPSYSASIVSDMLTDEMNTVEEEDEEDLDEDSSMNDFINDEATSESASSTPGHTPQPVQAPRLHGRIRRVVESETSSNMSQVAEEDEDEEGPIPNGRRRQQIQARILSRANGSRRTASSTSTETSAGNELDEDTQALLQEEGWSPLAHDVPDDEMDEDDDSDGGRTTVGWEQTTISNDRARIGGSLTPTADRPNVPIRPPSRVGNPRFLDGSRGLRRRSSVLSTSTVHYEDGEADDDDSDLDHDGDINMAANTLRTRQPRVQMRNNILPNNPVHLFPNRGLSQSDAVDLDTDDNSDTSQQPVRRRGSARARQQEYDPRISWMFASHLADLREFERSGAPYDHLDQLRSTTPIARPRTANRNRTNTQSPALQFPQSNGPFPLPGTVPSRLRTPIMDSSSNNAAPLRGTLSQSRRSGVVSNVTAPPEVGRNSGMSVERATSVDSISSGLTDPISTPTSSVRSASLTSVNAIPQANTAAAVDVIDRPPSQVSSRPPSAAGRRGSAGLAPPFQGLSNPAVGLNFGARIFQTQAQPIRNPWATYFPQTTVRTRTSRQALRDQSSTATLRASNSRAHLRNQPSQVNIRDVGGSPQTVRTQASRINLRHQQSQRRLNSQASTRTLRASEQARPPQSPIAATGLAPIPAVRSAAPRLTQDECLSLGRELVSNRARELGTYQPGTNQSRTNPFAAGARRQGLPNRDNASTPADAAPSSATGMNTTSHNRTSSNESIPASVNLSPTSSPHSPNLNRRRSNRNMSVPPGLFQPNQPPYSSPQNAYNNGYVRSRSGPLPGSPAYESPINTNPRGMSPMVAAGDRGRY